MFKIKATKSNGRVKVAMAYIKPENKDKMVGDVIYGVFNGEVFSTVMKSEECVARGFSPLFFSTKEKEVTLTEAQTTTLKRQLGA